MKSFVLIYVVLKSNVHDINVEKFFEARKFT